MPATTAGRRALCALVVLLAAVAGTVLGAAPAAAHAVLTATQPERGATVTEPLDAVVLEFNEGVVFPQVQVSAPDGERVEEGLPVEAGQSVEQPLRALPEGGTYTVVFRVSSDDGHPVEGEFEFVYEGPVGGEDEGDPPGDADPPDQDGQPAQDAPAEQDGVSLGGPALGVAVAVLVGFAGVAVLAARGRRPRDGDGDGGAAPADPAA